VVGDVDTQGSTRSDLNLDDGAKSPCHVRGACAAGGAAPLAATGAGF